MEDYTTFPQLFDYVICTYESDKILNKRTNNKWKSFSTEEFGSLVRRLALGLSDFGIKQREGVAILSQSSPEWIIVDLAIMICGGITVPIFKKISPESLEFELSDAGVRYLFLGDGDELEFVRTHGKILKKIIPFNGDDPALDTSFFSKLIETGAGIEKKEPGRFKEMLSQVKKNDIASFVYTSGSTGLPKGAELTQKNIISQVRSAFVFFPLSHETDVALSALPLAHVFERMVVYFYLSRGVPVYFVDNIGGLGDYMIDVKPTTMTVVPRILEKVHSKIKSKVYETRGFKRSIALAAFRQAEKKKGINPIARLLDIPYRKLVYSKFVAAFGGRLKYLICGASALPIKTARFVENIGAPLFEGYGLTEASPVVAANCPAAHKTGTVGKPFPDVEVRIGDDDEILVKGPNVMVGYHNHPEATHDMIDADGWLHSGDLGKFDKQGFLSITGRKKELFKKSTGEYVPPVPIEQAISTHEIIDAAMVIADGREVTTCLLFPDFEKLREYKSRHGFSQTTDKDFLQSQWLKNNLHDFIENVNTHLHHCEKVRKFAIIENPISVETGELTPTLKIRRSIIEKKYKTVIDELYEGKK